MDVWKAKHVALWNRNSDRLQGDLIGPDNSEEPRISVEEVRSLYGEADDALESRLASWEPLLRDRPNNGWPQ